MTYILNESTVTYCTVLSVSTCCICALGTVLCICFVAYATCSCVRAVVAVCATLVVGSVAVIYPLAPSVSERLTAGLRFRAHGTEGGLLTCGSGVVVAVCINENLMAYGTCLVVSTICRSSCRVSKRRSNYCTASGTSTDLRGGTGSCSAGSVTNLALKNTVTNGTYLVVSTGRLGDVRSTIIGNYVSRIVCTGLGMSAVVIV